jgi:hypothetical protein
MTDYRFDPDLEECINEVLMQCKEVARLAHIKNVMLSPITPDRVLAEASRILIQKMQEKDMKRSAQLDREKAARVQYGYPDNLQ